MKWQKWRSPLRVVLALFFIAAGIGHFLRPDWYLRIMPPYLPWHRELVYISGVFEILGGVGLLVLYLRVMAGYGLILLLAAVFPANVQMFVNYLTDQGWTLFTMGLLLRLPLQVPLILWVWWAMHEG